MSIPPFEELNMSFSRFRNQHHSSSSYTRDTRDKRPLYKPKSSKASSSSSSSSSSPRTPSLEEDIIPLTSSLSISCNNSFTMKTLKPRRLSMRLKSKPTHEDKTSTSRSHTDPLPLSSQASERGVSGGRADFIYKPIRRTDYTAAVGTTAMNQSHTHTHTHTQRPTPTPICHNNYNYIPSARGRHALDEKVSVPVRARLAPSTDSRSRSRARAHYDHDEEDLDSKGDLYNDLDEEYITARPRDSDVYSSAAEKRRHKAAKRLTTVMVADEQDIYG